MRSLRYLNTVLTILTVLLTLQLWTTWTAEGTSGDEPWSGATPAMADGIPNPGAQRKQIVDLLKRLVDQNEQLNKMFQSGQARVRVEGRAKGD